MMPTHHCELPTGEGPHGASVSQAFQLQGKRTTPSGKTFEGQFIEGRPAAGVVKYPDGRVLDGVFINGKLSYGNA